MIIIPFYDDLYTYLNDYDGHTFVVYDSSYDYVTFEGSSKIDEDYVNYFCKVFLDGLHKNTDSTGLALWHPSAAGASEGRGWSVAWENAPRARLQITRENDVFKLAAIKRSHGKGKPDPIDLVFSPQGLLVTRGSQERKVQEEAIRKACVKVAIEMYGENIPVQKQRKIEGSQLERFRSAALERSLDNKTVKDYLFQAIDLKELIYVTGKKAGASGFAPPPPEDDTVTNPSLQKEVDKLALPTGVEPLSPERLQVD